MYHGHNRYREEPPRHLPPPQPRRSTTCLDCGEVLEFKVDNGVIHVDHICQRNIDAAQAAIAMATEHAEMKLALGTIADNLPAVMAHLIETLQAEEREDMRSDPQLWPAVRVTLDPVSMARVAVLASKTGYTPTTIARHLIRCQLTVLQERITGTPEETP